MGADELYKSFSLQPVKEVYSSLQYGRDVYFLDENNEPVKVKNIEKIKYDGKIYDVDVPNDIVLVKKGNGSAFWSGNSNNGTVAGGANWNSSWKYGWAWQFDGVNDKISTV